MFAVFSVLFIFVRGLQKTKLFATMPIPQSCQDLIASDESGLLWGIALNSATKANFPRLRLFFFPDESEVQHDVVCSAVCIKRKFQGWQKLRSVYIYMYRGCFVWVMPSESFKEKEVAWMPHFCIIYYNYVGTWTLPHGCVFS